MKTEQEILFDHILESCKGSIYRICKAYANDLHDRDDLFQEVLFNIWRSLPGFRKEAGITTWVYRIALNVCLRWKMRSRKTTVPIEKVKAAYAADDTSAGEANARYEQLYKCITTLNDADKTIVLLYLDDLSYREIAGITGLTENHVAVKLKRIREKLFECLTTNE